MLAMGSVMTGMSLVMLAISHIMTATCLIVQNLFSTITLNIQATRACGLSSRYNMNYCATVDERVGSGGTVMPLIEHQEFVKASVERCFDLARDVDIHTRTTESTKEKAIGGVTTGLLLAEDFVTWEAVHFGIRQRLTAKVTVMDRPYMFEDIMVKGAFHSFTHTHEFLKKDNGTLMIDRFQYKSPYGLIGVIADKLFLESYMRNFIISRARALKYIAENE